MKTLKDIENLSLEQLEEISKDENISVPAGLEADIMATLDEAQRVQALASADEPQMAAGAVAKEAQRRSRLLRWPALVSAAACFAVLAVVGTIYMSKPRVDLYAEPQDTFTDPMLAYAALESALGRIGSTMESGMEKTAAFDQTMEKATQALK